MKVSIGLTHSEGIYGLKYKHPGIPNDTWMATPDLCEWAVYGQLGYLFHFRAVIDYCYKNNSHFCNDGSSCGLGRIPYPLYTVIVLTRS
jgi:hypothetical protein